jgi:uncharacterized protein YndB with AHSA1/START domain
MLAFNESAVIDGDPAAMWKVMTDLPALPEWDPHMEGIGFDGPLRVGAEGWTKPKGAPKGKFTVTAVEPERSYSTRSPMPMGSMSVTNTLEPVAGGAVRITRHVEVRGGFSPMFKWFFMKPMRRDLLATFQALGVEARRRTTAV